MRIFSDAIWRNFWKYKLFRVSTKVVKIIQIYVGIVNKIVWRKEI